MRNIKMYPKVIIWGIFAHCAIKRKVFYEVFKNVEWHANLQKDFVLFIEWNFECVTGIFVT